MRNAGVVLDFAPDLADAVIAGTVALDAGRFPPARTRATPGREPQRDRTPPLNGRRPRTPDLDFSGPPPSHHHNGTRSPPDTAKGPRP